jgi:hypothetical protein
MPTPTYRSAHLCAPPSRASVAVRPTKMLTPHSESLIQWSRILGKGLTLWVGMTSALNWMVYRAARKRAEDDDEDLDGSA